MNIYCRVLRYLPTAYVVRGKVTFRHVSVHPSVCPREGGVTPPGRDGYPSEGGTPTWPGRGGRSRWGYPPAQVQMGGYPLAGVPPPRQGVPPVQDNRWSTWYTAVGMPLAFTQEDFLVIIGKTYIRRTRYRLCLSYESNRKLAGAPMILICD